MIDSLQLNLTEFEIDKDPNLVINPFPFNPREKHKNNRILFSDVDGKMYNGKNAYHNSDILNLDIRTYFKQGIKAHLKYSLPKVYNDGINFHPVPKENLKDLFGFIENYLDEEVGVKTKLIDSKIGRIDLFKNILTNENFHSYKPIFKKLDMKRKPYTREYPTTYLQYNSISELCIYDKIEDMTQKIKNVNLSNYPKYCSRFEVRDFKNRNIVKKINIKTVQDILDNYDLISKYYNNQMMGLFNLSPKEFIGKMRKEQQPTKHLTEKELTKRILNFKLIDNSRNYLDNFFKFYGINTLVELSGSIDIVKNAVYNVTNDKSRKTRIEKKFDSSKNQLDIYGNKKYSELYQELKDKVLDIQLAA
jgi:hypothetical protein